VSAVNDDFTNFSTNTSNVTFTNVGDESNLLSDNGLNTNSGDGVDNLASNNSNIIYISPNGTGSGANSSDASNWSSAYDKITDNGCIIFGDGTYNLVNQSISKNLTLTANNIGNVSLTSSNTGYVFSTGNCSVNFNGLTFINSSSAIFADSNNLIFNNCYFYNNTAESGSAIFAFNSNLIINNSVFKKNHAQDIGGAVYLFRGSLLNNNTVYLNNSAGVAGAICVIRGNISNINSSFYSNTVTGFS
jgi:hypothetical protein